jgi:hypothetical protein
MRIYHTVIQSAEITVKIPTYSIAAATGTAATEGAATCVTAAAAGTADTEGAATV